MAYCAVEFLYNILMEEKRRLGECSPQFSYYDRLLTRAVDDSSLYDKICNHVRSTGGFSGL